VAELGFGIEIERKYVILMPDTEMLASLEGYTESEIVQTYLSSLPAVTRRVRKRSFPDVTRYYETRKTRIDSMSVIEEEGEISFEEYERLSGEIMDGTRPITKKRYTFIYKKQVFEIDIYPEWQRSAIMETELPSRDASPEIPDFISIVREVTGEKAYSNASMSRKFPRELV
jgi:CYTH domain-containing protein